MKNPWLRTPKSKPYILPIDKRKIRHFSDKLPAGFLKTHLLPIPFLGNPLSPVILLSLNPGYAPKEDEKHQLTPKFKETCRKSLAHREISYPFYFLDPKIEGENSGPGYRWWMRKLSPLLKQLRQDEAFLSKRLFCIEYFPYRSRNYRHMKEPLDSQQYGFELARDAMRRKAHIILMRAKHQWFQALPELEKYENLYILKNPRNPTISKGNMPKGFWKIISALEAS
jgi:hypothetical protein